MPQNTTEQQITTILQAELEPDFLQIFNDSHLHAMGRTDSHFRIVVVSSAFADLSLIKRHKKIYALLADLMQTIHALVLQTHTPSEWQKNNQEIKKPAPCKKNAVPK